MTTLYLLLAICLLGLIAVAEALFFKIKMLRQRIEILSLIVRQKAVRNIRKETTESSE